MINARDWPPVMLFDMDGTLLDLSFDNQIWLEQLPLRWAEQQHCTLATAQARLGQFYQAHHGTLNWYSSRFWQAQLGIDVLQLQYHWRHQISLREGCIDLLDELQRRGVTCWLVTNADRATLQLKLDHLALENHDLRPYFTHRVSSESLGYPKEDIQFWHLLQQQYALDPAQAWLIDDNLAVLDTAKRCGVARCIAVTQPDRRHSPVTLPRQYYPDQIAQLPQLSKLIMQSV